MSRLTLTVIAALLPLLSSAHPMSVDSRAEWQAEADAERATARYYRVQFANPETARKAMISLHEAVVDGHWKQAVLVMQLDDEELARLRPFARRIDPADDFAALRQRQLDALSRQANPRILGRAASQDVGAEAIPGYSCYETVEETQTAAQALVSARPTLASYNVIGSSWEKANGLGGYDLKVLKLTNSAIGGDKPKLFVNSAIHAREYVTAPTALALAQQLVNGYGTDPEATWILDHHEVHLLLHTNPDGRKKAETGLLWRKNTNRNYCGANSNSRGADLNRNFTFNWNITNGQGSSSSACADTYRGPSAGSEPEIQAVQAYVRSLWPDRRGTGVGDAAPRDTSGIHIDLHSYGQLVLWPWGSTATLSGNATDLQTLGRRFAYLNGHFPEQSIGLYPTDGTSDGISYGELGVAAYTFEMGTTFFQGCGSYPAIKAGNLAALMYAAKVVRAPYLLPSGPDALSLGLSANNVTPGTPVTLRATIDATRFSNANGKQATPRISAATAYVDVPPWAPGATGLPMAATDGAFGGKTEAVQVSLPTAGLSPGRHLVWVAGTNAKGRTGPVSAVFLDIQ
ncbi:hypothetical protein KAK07_17675 [Ideonella sp. 4Y16]|uniref:carboxypeptidase T n=1 Tax=Ideonella alba TaxID=2824118 RepID=A0A940YAC8_9BURK|nr:M14 family zinc carboxypeptidase [Ideonella alba]MBQ0930578.1 hypothetical protein [Ideonella alba]MBQ0945172.1 hypothetical protein [Ideonella alba]